MGADRDDRDVARRGLGAQPAQHLVAVDARQLDVEQDQVRPRARDLAARLRATRRSPGCRRVCCSSMASISSTLTGLSSMYSTVPAGTAALGHRARPPAIAPRSRCPRRPRCPGRCGRASARRDACSGPARCRQPSIAAWSAPRRSKAWNSRSFCAASSPGPVSLTTMHKVPSSCSALHAHLAAGAVVLDGVGQQVQQHLLQALTVGQHRARGSASPAAASCTRVLLRHRLDGRAGSRAAAAPRPPARPQRQLPGLDARQVEQFVDQLQQALAGTQDLAPGAARGRRQRQRRVAVEQLAEAQDGVHRRAQLVAHARQELRLGAVGRFGLVACVHQLQRALLHALLELGVERAQAPPRHACAR